MKMKKLIILLVFALAGSGLYAQADLVTADDLTALMKNAGQELVIIDANKAKNYQSSHVKGAININHLDLYQEGEVDGLIKSPEELSAFFGGLGLTESSRIVIYDDGSQKYSTRIYWILKYLGAQNVALLHRDLDAWRKARVPLTAEVQALPPATFTAAVDPSLFATLDYVKENKDLPGFVLIDARTADEFAGVNKSEGHIPGAINLNFEELLTETGAFKPVEELQAIAAKYELTPDKELILYCKTSVRAAVEYVAFKNLLGFEKVRVYDGAYNEWIVQNPVVQ